MKKSITLLSATLLLSVAGTSMSYAAAGDMHESVKIRTAPQYEITPTKTQRFESRTNKGTFTLNDSQITEIQKSITELLNKENKNIDQLKLNKAASLSLANAFVSELKRIAPDQIKNLTIEKTKTDTIKTKLQALIDSLTALTTTQSTGQITITDEEKSKKNLDKITLSLEQKGQMYEKPKKFTALPEQINAIELPVKKLIAKAQGTIKQYSDSLNALLSVANTLTTALSATENTLTIEKTTIDDFNAKIKEFQELEILRSELPKLTWYQMLAPLFSTSNVEKITTQQPPVAPVNPASTEVAPDGEKTDGKNVTA